MATASLKLNNEVTEIVNESVSTNNIINVMGTSIPLNEKYIGGSKYTFVSRYDLLTGMYPPQFSITNEQPEGIEITSVEMLIPDLTSNTYKYVESLYNEEFPIYPNDIYTLDEFPYITKLNSSDDSNLYKSRIGYSVEDLDPIALQTTKSNVYKIKFRYVYKLEPLIYGDKFHYLHIYVNSINPTSSIPYPPDYYISQFTTKINPESITELGNNLIKDSKWNYHIDGFQNVGIIPTDETSANTTEVQQIRFNSVAQSIYPEFDLPSDILDMFTKVYFFKKDYSNIYSNPEIIDDRLTYFGKPIIEGQSIPYRAVKEGRVLFNTLTNSSDLPVLYIGFDVISGGLIQLYETQII